MKDEHIKEFYNQVCKNLDGEYKIVLETKRNITEKWIEYDTVEWKMENPVKDLVDKVLLETNLTLEEKILKVYEFICMHYIYDANVLYFFKRDESDPNNIKYIAVDWYGRVVGPEWFEQRQSHNRRICYEFSRMYAKAINTLIGNSYDLEAFLLGDVENTHYVVGLAGKDYNAILDQDDFSSIKDLTRLKMGLTIKGIHVLKDETGKLKNAVEDFNRNRLDELPEITKARKISKENNSIEFFKEAIIAINKYNIDSQGFFEYMRTLIEQEGIKIKKIWKRDTKNSERRYERCLYFEFDNNTYLLDSIEKTLAIVKMEELNKDLFVFNAEDNMYEYYGG